MSSGLCPSSVSLLLRLFATPMTASISRSPELLPKAWASSGSICADLVGVWKGRENFTFGFWMDGWEDELKRKGVLRAYMLGGVIGMELVGYLVPYICRFICRFILGFTP